MVEVRVRAAMAAAALAEDTVANMVAVGSKAVVVSSPQVGLVGGAAPAPIRLAARWVGAGAPRIPRRGAGSHQPELLFKIIYYNVMMLPLAVT